MTDDEIKGYATSETLWEDDMFVHFEKHGAWDWIDVGNEGRRVLSLLEDRRIHEDSPISHILSAIAAQASDGTYSAVAAALGVDVKALRLAVSPWYEAQKSPPVPVGFEGLKAEIDESKAWMEDLAAGKFSVAVDASVTKA